VGGSKRFAPAEDSVLSPPLVSLARGAVVAALALLSPVATRPVRELSARTPVADEDGYDLWLRYRSLPHGARYTEYRRLLSHVVIETHSPTLDAARDELAEGLRGLLDQSIPVDATLETDGSIVIGTPSTSPIVASLGLASQLKAAGDEGFVLRAAKVNGKRVMVVAGNRDVGVLYGAFALLRRVQTMQPIGDLSVTSAPRIKLRMLDHWDNLDRSVERGYAGRSIWDWSHLPDSLPARYRDYARANASIGINGVSITNVNANAKILTAEYLTKVAALASVFRPYGIRVFLTARFSAPIEIGGLKTADPLDSAVGAWWKTKTDEIYRNVPDFGGFVVKANSEGQPGPQDYKRTHADGANMLADAVAPHGGVVMWRAFVYSSDVPTDRIRQAYDEFKPLDGQFRANVFVQVKNGPLDFQPREPFSPLFGAMSATPLMAELQITKEYLGQDTHLVYLAPLFKEVLDADTYAKGKGSTVGSVIDGSLFGGSRSGIAGVANIGDDRNWTGSQFNQANWYAFGRLAWDHTLTSPAIADEWIRMTFSNDPKVVPTIRSIMLTSREAVVNYMTPLGLVHIMANNHHYGPGPWAVLPRADQSPPYFHRADSLGIGFDRTSTGSNAVAQYASPLRDLFASDAVPEQYLLFFHHVPWTHRMKSGRTLWEELARHYQEGVDSVRSMRRQWETVKPAIDAERFSQTQEFLRIQEREAMWWRDAVMQYFQTFSHLPIPSYLEQPQHPLSFYRALRCPPDRNKPRCDAVY
jgi:alpha-glucuronidase